ncbi:MAG: D-alanine--D-alanine ligase [Bacteroidota bacterium]|jgi:D-alanine-D-alanine ligase|nr:D-alanine--D-alanine ligase [Bacteroidota bacterium]
MRIGLTYDLRTWYLERGYTMDETAEFDKEETVVALETELIRLGYETVRIGNIFQLVEKLAAGERWDMVFNIAEGLYGDGRESVVPALLDQYRIPYVFSGPVVMGVSLNKYITRLVVEAAGVPVCPGIIANSVHDLDDLSSLEFPLFVKPVAEGTGKGITTRSVVRDRESLVALVTELLASYNQPVLVEEYLPGREFTVGVTGNGADGKVTGGMEVICKDNLPYSVEVKENYENFVQYRVYDDDIKPECDAVALGAWRALGAVDAGRVDMRADRHGRMCFIEANPLAGLNPVHSDLPMLSRMNGLAFSTLIEMIMNSATKRYGLK